MSDTTNIEWCDSTFNPWIGCTRVSPACDDCYAARSTPARTMGIAWGAREPRRRTSASNWAEPLRWERQAAEFQAVYGRRRRVFCASLADVFDNEAPEAWRADLFRLIADTPSLDWLLLTKRIGNVADMIEAAVDSNDLPVWPWRHVWLGATVVNQAEADRDIPKLLAVPARVRFLSIEPMLGSIDLTAIPVGSGHGRHEFDPIVTANVLARAIAYPPLPELDWVIAGGESGPKARPSHPDWYRSLRDQCAAAGAPFLFKQWGEWADALYCVGGDHRVAVFNDGEIVARVGKKLAGRLLDGVEHNGFPEARHA